MPELAKPLHGKAGTGPLSTMVKLERPKKLISRNLIEGRICHDWLQTLSLILHEKDKDCGLYTHDRTYPTYHAIAELLNPHSILEIGVRFGYSLASLACGAGPGVKVFGIDPEQYEKDSNARASASLKLLGVEAQLFLGDSKNFDVTGCTGQTSFGLIHIDGDHTTEGALQDLQRYASFSDRLLVDDVLDSRVWAAIQAFTSLQRKPISVTYFDTATGLILIEL